MTPSARWTICTCTAAALLAAPGFFPGSSPYTVAIAQAQSTHPSPGAHAKKPAAAPAAPAASGQPKLPPRTPFSAADDAAAAIPGMPDARFFGDSVADYTKALPSQPGPWLILSTGGEDGAFGAGRRL